MFPMFPKLILDENISNEIADMLEKQGYDIYAIRKKSRGMSDKEIILLSNKLSGIILTFDHDFGEYIYRFKISPYGLILLRIKDHSIQSVSNALEIIFTKLKKMNKTLVHQYLIYSESGMRIRNI